MQLDSLLIVFYEKITDGNISVFNNFIAPILDGKLKIKYENLHIQCINIVYINAI